MRKLIFLILILISNSTLAQRDQLFTQEDGLSNTSFYKVAQEKNGRIWVSTNIGLNSLDGYKFKSYYNAWDSISISSNVTQTVFVDSKNRIWIGTSAGFNKYNPESNTFSRFRPAKNASNYQAVTSIVEDKSGMLWLGTSIGLYQFNPNDNTFIPHSICRSKKDEALINTMLLDDEGNLWIGTGVAGLKKYNIHTKALKDYRSEKDNPNSLNDNAIMALCKTTSGEILIGTLKGGICVFNPKTDQFRRVPFSYHPDNYFDGGVRSIIQDRTGTIWVGTERNGLKIFDFKNYKILDGNSHLNVSGVKDSKIHCFEDREGNLWFTIDHIGLYLKKQHKKPFHYIDKFSTQSVTGLSNNKVRALLIDKNNQLWAGTDGGGLNLLKPGENQFINYKSKPGVKGYLQDNALTAIHEDGNNNIWIGSYLGGLSYLNQKDGTFKSYLIDSAASRQNGNYIISIQHDKQNNLYVGSMGRGMYRFDRKAEKFIKIDKIKVGSKVFKFSDFVYDFYIDRNDNFWVAGEAGIFCFNESKGILKEYSWYNNKMGIHAVNDFYDDGKYMWIATFMGLYKIDQATEEVKKYFMDSLPSNNYIYSILEDNENNLWISTIKGLSRFNKTKETFRTYYIQDGLPTNEFLQKAKFKAKDGTLYFGSTNGFIFFKPEEIKEINKNPEIVFSELKVFNERVNTGRRQDGTTILEKTLDKSEQITLNYSDNNFSIEFSAIDYTAPGKVKYAYMLDGFDKDWIIQNQREAVYSNISPGNYVFKVKSTNSDGVWQENARSVKVLISPPFWKTWWMYLIYFAVAVIIVIYARKLLFYRLKMQSQLHLERMEREKQEEINSSKLKFFTNISHELRTPLTLILGPSEKLAAATDLGFEHKKYSSIIFKSANRLLKLTNQLLDLQKIEENQISLKVELVDLVVFVQDVKETFEEVAVRKNISLLFDTSFNRLEAWIDKDHLDKILINLISNALKFNKENGYVSISINKALDKDSIEFAEIVVSDSGKGIRQEHLNKIFERFYQVPESSLSLQKGSGIGLHLTKSLVELHKGSLLVKSKEGQGSSFIIRLPLGQAHLAQHQFKTELHDSIIDQFDFSVASIVDAEGEKAGETKKLKDNKILIVEDDPEILNYLQAELESIFYVFTANDGKAGFQIASQEIPDLIISDVMMPEMNGIELCKALKSDINTCHIPVILLTAKTAMEHQLEGLETGADDYISKPFRMRHLLIRINNLIELRENLRKKFTSTLGFVAKEMTIMSADEKFLQKAMDYVKDNISDPDLNIEEMGKELGMSRVHLYRKIKSLTNQSPSEFVRTIRLKQAAYLLKQNKLNKSEVAYMVGFSSPQYFSNCFQEYFNMSPSEFCEKNKVA